MGNAHAWRHRTGRGNPCPTGCLYCKMRPKEGEPGERHKNYANKNSRGRHTPRGKQNNKKRKSPKLKLGIQ